MEVACRDRGQSCCGDPTEELRSVEELEAMDEPAQRLVPGEALRQAGAALVPRAVERVRRDDRGAGLNGRLDCLRDPVVDGDEAS